jgi:dTDP-4-dehydrorhamnose reductase
LHTLFQAGHEILALHHQQEPGLPPGWPGDGSRLVRMDLADRDALTSLLLDFFPDLIVNAAAVADPGAVEADPKRAEQLNVALPRRLAQVASHFSARLFHLSTDMVFDGRQAPYRSTDTPNPAGLYGQLKLMAEREVLREGGPGALVLRLPLVTGNSPGGRRSVHEKLFEQWASGKPARLFTDELRQPVSAQNLSELIAELVDRPNLHGLFHWSGADVLSRYEIGRRIAAYFGVDEAFVEPAQLAGDPAHRDRPADLRLDLQPLRAKVKLSPAPFDEQLALMQVPAPFARWYAEACPRAHGSQPIKRYVRGRDF